jgi:hypothetical protein
MEMIPAEYSQGYIDGSRLGERLLWDYLDPEVGL